MFLCHVSQSFSKVVLYVNCWSLCVLLFSFSWTWLFPPWKNGLFSNDHYDGWVIHSDSNRLQTHHHFLGAVRSTWGLSHWLPAKKLLQVLAKIDYIPTPLPLELIFPYKLGSFLLWECPLWKEGQGYSWVGSYLGIMLSQCETSVYREGNRDLEWDCAVWPGWPSTVWLTCCFPGREAAASCSKEQCLCTAYQGNYVGHHRDVAGEGGKIKWLLWMLIF